jgi:glycerophosphoryl diester phosphodiesterase
MGKLNILDNIKIGGHRGMGCTDHPFTLERPKPNTRPTENTTESVRQAFQKGCDFVEVDVVLTKDNIPVCLHNVIPEDHFFDKIPDRPINMLNYNELLKYECGRTKKSQVSTLEQILEVTHNNSQRTLSFDINIELKGIQSSNQKATRLDDFCRVVAETLRNSKLETPRILISSFCLEMLIVMMQEIPECQYGMLFAEINGSKPLFSDHQRDFAFASINFSMDNLKKIENHCENTNIDPANIKYLHPEIKTIDSEILNYSIGQGKQINTWSLYEIKAPSLNAPLIKALHNNYQFGIITDFPDLDKDILNQLC